MQMIFEKKVFRGGHHKSNNSESILLKFRTVSPHIAFIFILIFKVLAYFKVKKLIFQKKIFSVKYSKERKELMRNA